MGINESLLSVKASLVRAKAEIVAKLDDLSAQLENSPESVDPALVEEIKGLAQSLDDIVPNEPITEDTPASE